jgi:spermidine/putrescine transport system ATP-binding protein
MPALARCSSSCAWSNSPSVRPARALAPQPKVLLLDEPLSALDYKLRKEMQIELKRLQTETGITFVFVTHDQEEALTMSDRIAVMSSGNILQVGSPREIYDTPANRFVADFIGETNFLKGKITAIDGGNAALTLPAGATLSAASPDNAKSGDEITVMVRPEHARLANAERGEQAILTGALSDIIYFGTDTYFNVKLPDGEIFTVRQQNRPGEENVRNVGDAAGVTFSPSAIRVLRA